jgi:hypothetical protein
LPSPPFPRATYRALRIGIFHGTGGEAGSRYRSDFVDREPAPPSDQLLNPACWRRTTARPVPALDQPSEICRANLAAYEDIELCDLPLFAVEHGLAKLDLEAFWNQDRFNEMNECFEPITVRHSTLGLSHAYTTDVYRRSRRAQNSSPNWTMPSGSLSNYLIFMVPPGGFEPPTSRSTI